MMHRRAAVKLLATLAGVSCLPIPLQAAPKKRFRIGACDWSIQRINQPEAMAMAREIGLDGVQVSLGSVANNMHLRESAVQAAYKKAAQEAGVSFAGLAIGEMNNIPYKSDPRTIQWVSDSVDVAKALGCRVILLAFFDKGDLKNDAAGQAEVIRRLREVAPKAEKAGIYLGIESWLSAEEHMRILDSVGSSHVKVYYDVANSHKMGYNIYQEIRSLGKHICEFHAKENGVLLGKGAIDFQQVRQAMDDIGYKGWLQIEGAVPPGATMLDSYKSNQAFLRSIFPE
jgi:L-ribulose-5-phosphate 3-epimerase